MNETLFEVDRDNSDTDYDKYYTPRWPVEVLLDMTGWDEEFEIIGEPCAGMGHMTMALEENGLNVVESDLCPEGNYPKIDARDLESLEDYYGGWAEAFITNPPYSADTGSAAEIVETVFNLKKPCAFLLRLTFLEPCHDRTHLLKHLQKVIVLPRVEYYRPVNECSSGNPMTSAWFIFDGKSPERFHYLNAHQTVTPKKVESILISRGLN